MKNPPTAEAVKEKHQVLSPFNFDVVHSATEPFAVANGSWLSTYSKTLTNYASDEDECHDPLAIANGSVVDCFFFTASAVGGINGQPAPFLVG